MKYLFGAIYVLVLVTQLLHIWSAYALTGAKKCDIL